MRRCKLIGLLVGVSVFSAHAQLKSESDVTLTLDMLPILQLQTNSASSIKFDFNQLSDYQSGVTLYGATTLKVNATVTWDLYVVAKSSGNVGAGYWDQQMVYGQNGSQTTNQIPLSALELHQSSPNQYAAGASGIYVDYSSPFPPVSSPSGSNSVYVDPTGGDAPPSDMHKYIAGHAGTGGTGNDGVFGGSYLNAGTGFAYSIDYRIVPGLPSVFPMAFDATGQIQESIDVQKGTGVYVQPGVYTMFVQYLLVEDQ